jgi:tRNA A-37 threonylcarbamoyl transferase component Bud32
MLKAGAPTQELVDEAGPDGAKTVQPPICPTPAEIAGHFAQLEILECLGRGGMGMVYKARQPKLNRLVALKLLAPEKGDDPRFAERFEREAQALARLNHPNIVTVYDFGMAGGRCYLLMEFVDGTSLRQLLQAGSLAPEQALAIVPRICDALQFAHDKGVVHRDIKPENVLLDKEGWVKIADFGIAKIIAPEGSERALTQDQQVMGTPHYMAPEQVEKPGRVDHRADIYSLGVVFYEMLTGELPLGRFAPPSSRVRGIQVDVRLNKVVLHALEKEPDRRYQHASEVKTDVETIASSARTKSRVGVAPFQQEQAPPSSRTSQVAEARGWLVFFFSLFWLMVGLKKDLPVVAVIGVVGVLWGVSQVGLVEWWRSRLGRLCTPDPIVADEVAEKSPSPPFEWGNFALGYSVVGVLALVECGLIAMGVATNTAQWLVAAAASAVVWGVASMICTAHVLSKRGIPINYPLLGLLMVFEYLPRYRALTLRETGRVGPLFYSYIVAMSLALSAVVLLLVVHRWGRGLFYE